MIILHNQISLYVTTLTKIYRDKTCYVWVCEALSLVGVQIGWYLEDINLALAIYTCESGIDRSRDPPHILDEFGVTRDYCPLIQLKEIIA